PRGRRGLPRAVHAARAELGRPRRASALAAAARGAACSLPACGCPDRRVARGNAARRRAGGGADVETVRTRGARLASAALAAALVLAAERSAWSRELEPEIPHERGLLARRALRIALTGAGAAAVAAAVLGLAAAPLDAGLAGDALGVAAAVAALALLARLAQRSEEHTSELQSPDHLVCRLLLEKKNKHLRHRATSTTRSNTASNRTRPKSQHQNDP